MRGVLREQVAGVGRDRVPDGDGLPRRVAPLPDWLEALAYRLVWPVVAANLLGTAFGFWYYRFQFAATRPVMWPLVPDSPGATLFVALALGAWALGRHSDTLSALAFFGSIKLGAWTPFVLTAFTDSFLAAGTPPWLFAFLFVSHCAMVVQAFVLHRITDFPVYAVTVAAGWYALNDVVDYFVPLVGEPHHSYLPPEYVGGEFTHAVPAHDLAAAGAVLLTLTATLLALATRVYTCERRRRTAPGS